jgi:hypothetical protein
MLEVKAYDGGAPPSLAIGDPMRTSPFRVFLIAFLLPLASLTIGCDIAPNAASAANTTAQGHIFGGQQPIAGATLQLYAVGTTADGSAATPLLTQTVTSAIDGSFNITGLYPCAPGTLVYITATGGSPTATNGSVGPINANLVMLTALGPCDQLSASTFITINEVTTVAAVNALHNFVGFVSSTSNASSYSHIGSSASDAASLAAAFTLAGQLVDPATGSAPGSSIPTGYSSPATLINTVANILASCVNTSGGTAGDSSACGQLFSAASASGVPTPTDTFQALYLISFTSTPTYSTTRLFNLILPQAPFQPQLTMAPSKYAVALVAGGLILTPSSLTFPPVVVNGSNNAVLNITLTNTGPTTIFITGVGIFSSDFKVTNCTPGIPSTCYCGSLASQASCTLPVTFQPAIGDYGSLSANLVVSGNPNSSATATLYGTGSH